MPRSVEEEVVVFTAVVAAAVVTQAEAEAVVAVTRAVVVVGTDSRYAFLAFVEVWLLPNATRLPTTKNIEAAQPLSGSARVRVGSIGDDGRIHRCAVQMCCFQQHLEIGKCRDMQEL